MKKFDATSFIEKHFKKYSYDLGKIVGINPFNFDDKYLLENGILSKINTKDVKQEHLLATYIPNKNVITYEFKLAKNLLEKVDLDDYIETKCYEDVGLDEADEYIFKHKMIEGVEEKEFSVEVVIIPQKDIELFYKPITDKYGYLDFTTYSGYVFNALYKDEILEPQNDLFIYFSEDDIFITLYSEGRFLQTSVIPEGLRSIYETLTASIKTKNFDFDVFLSLLVKKGLDLNNYNEKEHILFNELSELFSNKFLIISNQIHLIVRKFSLTTIDRIFMATIKGTIPGISEFANMYLGVEANDLKFDTKYNPDNIEIDQILFLSMLYAKVAYSTDFFEDNLNIFKRPPTFFYRKSGQLISISVASLIISLIYPTYQIVDTYLIDRQNQKMQLTLNQLKSLNNQLKTKNKKLQNELEAKKQQKEKLLTYISNIKYIIDTIYKEKEGYVPKSLIMTTITKYLYENRVLLTNLEYEEGEFVLDLYAQTDKDITNFIDNVVKKEHMVVDTDGYKKLNSVYQATVRIKVGR
jgi:cell division protein FtsB